jgi:hypothetical protein
MGGMIRSGLAAHDGGDAGPVIIHIVNLLL